MRITGSQDHTNRENTMETMKLFRGIDGWNVRTDNQRTIELFGTDVLPTGFTERAEAETVLNRIKELNPDADVVLI